MKRKPTPPTMTQLANAICERLGFKGKTEKGLKARARTQRGKGLVPDEAVAAADGLFSVTFRCPREVWNSFMEQHELNARERIAEYLKRWDAWEEETKIKTWQLKNTDERNHR